MNSQTASWNTFWSFSIAPFNWLLRLFGWTLSWKPMWDDPGWKWCIQRTKQNRTGQHLRYVQSETYWFRRTCHAVCFTWDVDTSGKTLHIHIGLFGLFMHYTTWVWAEECWFKKLLRNSYEKVEYGLTINKYALMWCWRQNEHSSARDGSTGFTYRLSWSSFQENPKVVKETLWERTGVPFVQPAFGSRPASEHTVDLMVYVRDVRWRRPWNSHRNHGPDYSVKLTLQKPPRFSGKGESSHDCDDDGLYGVSFGLTEEMVDSPQAVIINHAIERYIAMVEFNRKEHG